MKSLKSKVIASAAMLLVAAVMMTSSSFAWYTLSTKGDLEKVKVNFEAVDNLEIAISKDKPGEVALGGSGDQRTWGTKAGYIDTKIQLKQAATWKDNAIRTAVYGSDGRLKDDLVKAVETQAPSYDLTGATPQLLSDKASTTASPAAARYDFWIRTNNTNEIQISADSTAFKGTGDAKLKLLFVDAKAVEDNAAAQKTYEEQLIAYNNATIDMHAFTDIESTIGNADDNGIKKTLSDLETAYTTANNTYEAEKTAITTGKGSGATAQQKQAGEQAEEVVKEKLRYVIELADEILAKATDAKNQTTNAKASSQNASDWSTLETNLGTLVTNATTLKADVDSFYNTLEAAKWTAVGTDKTNVTNSIGTVKTDLASLKTTIEEKGTKPTISAIDTLGTWEINKNTTSVTPIKLTSTLATSGDDKGYFIKHIYMYAYIDGDTVTSKDLETVNKVESIAEFDGTIYITQPSK